MYGMGSNTAKLVYCGNPFGKNVVKEVQIHVLLYWLGHERLAVISRLSHNYTVVLSEGLH